MELENREAMWVLADELEERGDARAALVRAQLSGSEHGALLRSHWTEWVGSLDPRSTLLRWKWGHLIDVGIGAAPDGWSVEELLRLPTTTFLSRLALAPRVSSRGIDHAPSLRELVCFGPLEARELPALERLTVELDEASAERLASLTAPRLTALHTRARVRDESRLFTTLARAPWFARLRTWTHRLAAVENVAGLLAIPALVARAGAGLELLCTERVSEVTEALRHALPAAKVSLLTTPRPPSDPEDRHGPAQTHVVPARAPMDFRTRAPMEQTSTRGSQSDEPEVTCLGSGFALPDYRFNTCSWCGSANTLGIWSTTWSLYSHFETTSYADWEYECHDCGLFTTMREVRTR
ncbi:MAG: hypothetical protein ACOZQL_11880 [Myxococcota bacterium]